MDLNIYDTSTVQSTVQRPYCPHKQVVWQEFPTFITAKLANDLGLSFMVPVPALEVNRGCVSLGTQRLRMINHDAR